MTGTATSASAATRLLATTALLATAATVLVAPPAGGAPASQESPRLPACGALHVVAHRGHHGHVENTVAAFRSAVHEGADAIETDVRTSSDGKLVLMHDSTLGRTTTDRGRVHRLTGAEIHRVRTNDGQRVPYVDAALRFLQNRERITGVLELKRMTRASTIRLRRAIIEHGVMNQVTISSRRVKYLKRAKRIMPHVRRMRLTWQPVRPRRTARFATGVIIPLERLDAPRVKRYQRAGLTVTAMASTRPRSRKRMAEIGVDAVSSNNIPGYVEHCRTPLPEPEPEPDPRPHAGKRRPPQGVTEAPVISTAVAQRLGRIWVGLTLPQTLTV